MTARVDVHVLTPGDHFSPRTGSAIPTVVDGLCRAVQPGAPRPRAVVARGTYPERYSSAEVVDYAPVGPRPWDRYADLALARAAGARPGARRLLRPTVAEQAGWPPSVVLAHNAPQLVPLVREPHRAVLYAHNLLLRTYSRREAARVLGGARAIVCVSRALAEQTRDRLPPGLAERVHVVRNGVDTRQFHPRVDPARGERLRVVFVGRMIRDKGADVLLDAAALLRRRDVEVTLVGSQNFDAGAAPSAYERELRARAAGMGDRVRLLPFMPRVQVAALCRASDVLVVPSRWAEPFALTVMEGMASGVPVVASRIGGIPEVMGPAGLQVRPGDPADLAEAIDALASDEPWRLRLGIEARAWAEAHDWSWARRRLDTVLTGID